MRDVGSRIRRCSMKWREMTGLCKLKNIVKGERDDC